MQYKGFLNFKVKCFLVISDYYISQYKYDTNLKMIPLSFVNSIIIKN